MGNVNLRNPRGWRTGLAGILLLAASAVSAAEKITYYHLDALGSPVAATDEQGNVKWREEYKPYGERIKEEAGAQANSRWYTGHPHDDATGLTYMGARYYDPVVGRFMAVDPVAVTETNIHSFNRYGYGNNNPYRFIDPNGMWVEDVVIGVPSVALGVDSLWDNLKAGNWGAATVDAFGIGADLAAIATPGVPGGAGLGIKVSRKAVENTDEFVDGYRAVSKAEADDIAEHGFRPDPSGRSMQDKWFSETRAGAEKFREMYPDLETIVQTKVRRDVYERSYRHPNIDNTGPGFCVQCSDLPSLPKPK